MELISSINTTITDIVPKIIETPNNLIINTQVYTKDTLQPIPMHFTAWSCGFHHLLLKTRIDWNNEVESGELGIIYCHRVKNNPSIWVDTKDASNYYTIYRDVSPYSSTSKFDSVTLKQVNNVDNKITFLQTTNPYSHYYLSATDSHYYRVKNDMQILCETENYFIMERKAQSYSYVPTSGSISTEQLLRINKKKLTEYSVVKMITNSNSGAATEESHNNFFDYYYYLESKPNSEIVYLMERWKSSIVIYKYDAAINVLTQVYSYTNNNYRTISNAVKVGDYYYTLIDDYSIDDTTGHKYSFMKMKLDVSTDTVAAEVIPIDIGSNSEMVTRDYLYTVVNSLETFTVNDKDYIVCTLFATNFLRNADNHFHATIRVEADKGIVTDYVPLKTGCRGVLYYIQPTTCVFLMRNSFAFYVFDETSEAYMLTYTSPGLYKTIGFDMANRFYALSTDYTVEMLTYYSPTILKADFGEELYNRTSGASIETTISFYAKNFMDEYINTNVTLTLIGNVVFSDNGQKTIETNTSNTGVQTLPVTINGNGRIQVIITQTT